MFEITDFFHITHVVQDVDAAVDWYADVFSPIVFQRSEVLGSRLALQTIGDVVLMPLSPIEGVPTGVGKFRERVGPHLHSLALHLEDPQDYIDHFEKLGRRLTGARGGEVEGLNDEIWTRPRDFPGLYEMWNPHIETDPRWAEGWSSAFWRDEHPLGLKGPAWVTVVTGDLAGRVPPMLEAFRSPIGHEAETPFGTSSAFITLSPKVTLEVAQPLDSSNAAGADLERCGEIVHAVTFEVLDAGAAADHLAGKGLRVERPTDATVTVNPDDAHGVLFRFTETAPTAW
jgi:catechol 2,3-dioxygenase-like lactoylglutathione lyase family enzyme